MLHLFLSTALASDIPGPHAAHLLNPPSVPQTAYTPPPPGSTPPDVTVYGYHAYWTGDPLDLDFNRLTHLAIFNVDLNSDGTLSSTDNWTDVAGDVVDLAHAHGVKVHVCMTSFEDSVTNSVLSSSSRRATTIAALKALVDDYGADGVNVDIEGLDSDQRDNMTAFIEELGSAVDEIYIAMPAIDWNGAFDYEALADASDGLFIMGYGYHWSGGDPGPVAPLYGGSPWSDYALDWTVEDYLQNGAPADKIILGLPLYGREWPTTSSAVPGEATGTGVAFTMSAALDEAATHGSLYDEPTHTPYILQSNSQLWYDDVESVRDRIAFAVDEGLQGVGFWALQYEGDAASFWSMVSEETTTGSTDTGNNGQDTDTDGNTGGNNTPPVALAGLPILAYPQDTVILNGSPSYDEDGEIVSWQWAQIDGPEGTLDKAQTDRPRLYVPEPGVYEIELTITDDDQATGVDVVSVVVADPDAGKRFGSGGCSSLPVRVGGWMMGLLLLGLRRRQHG